MPTGKVVIRESGDRIRTLASFSEEVNMSKSICQRCNFVEGTLYRFYYGKTVGKNVFRTDVNQMRLETYYQIGGYRDTTLCDNCVVKLVLLRYLPILIFPAAFLFVAISIPITAQFRTEPLPGANIVALVAGVLGLCLLLICSLLASVLIKFGHKIGDQVARGESAAAHFQSGKNSDLKKQGYDVFWTTKEYDSLLNSGQNLLRKS